MKKKKWRIAMTVLEQIAFYQNRRDEVPNQELARKLAETRDSAGVREIAVHLWDKNPNVQSDCLKVLYETGYLAPELIAEYAPDFIKLTQNKNNRLVCGGMIALSTVAGLNPEPCFQQLGNLLKVIEAGSVITQDAGISTLAGIASAGETFSKTAFPHILDHLRTCGAKYMANRAEHVLAAVQPWNRAEFVAVLKARLPELSNSMAKRVNKLIKKYS
jgi:hypothetical protein